MLLGERPIVGVGEQPVEELAQVGIEGVPVETDRGFVLGVIGQHGATIPIAAPDAGGYRARVRPLLRFAAGAVALLLVLTACGGGDSTRLSRVEMVRRADALCADLLADADRLRARADPGARGDAASDEIDDTVEVLRRQIDAFDDLRGPPSTDAARERVVAQLRIAADALDELSDRAEADDLTVDEAIRANAGLIGRVNRASARASDALVDLGFLTCVGTTTR